MIEFLLLLGFVRGDEHPTALPLGGLFDILEQSDRSSLQTPGPSKRCLRLTGKIRSVGVLGAGTMGHGIAEVAGLAGFDVVLYDVQRAFLDAGVEKIRWSISKFVEKGAITKEKGAEVIGRIRPTLDLDELAGAELVIEAVPEELATKEALFYQLDQLNKKGIFASNTSTIPITEIAASVRRPERFVGLHFFNPPVKMPLVEVTRGSGTSQETVDVAVEFARQLGKQVVICNKDVPGFIVNRILGPLLNEAAWMVTRDEATIAEIDSSAVYKAGLPMGLFELTDYTGIDVVYKAAEAMKSREPSSILGAPLFKEKFEGGKLGKKSGEGFYVYAGPSRPRIDKEAGERLDPLSFFSVAVNAAAWLLRNQVCGKEDLDLSVKLGLGFPEGILQMADRWGIDRVVVFLKAKQDMYGRDYAPDPMLEEMVKKGELGVSTGRGFYEYSSSEKKFEEVVLKKTPPIAWVTLNRPHRLNTITPKMTEELEAVAREVAADDSVRVLVLTGEGGKAFSAGADVTSFGFGTPSKAFDASRRMFEVFSAFERLPKPVIAAINGYAFGGGCELALACDFRLASKSSQIGLTETNLGIIPGAGGTQRLIKLVGLAKAREMIYFGTRLPADDALQAGLVDHVFANEEFQQRVDEFARNLSKRAPLSLKFAKQALNLATQVPTDLGQYFEASSFALLLSTQDANEGIISFLSKKEPEFKGE
jgi:enoyl-CoA hydratase/3-hydroxyacyl-CoA dehydrogenase